MIKNFLNLGTIDGEVHYRHLQPLPSILLLKSPQGTQLWPLTPDTIIRLYWSCWTQKEWIANVVELQRSFTGTSSKRFLKDEFVTKRHKHRWQWWMRSSKYNKLKQDHVRREREREKGERVAANVWDCCRKCVNWDSIPAATNKSLVICVILTKSSEYNSCKSYARSRWRRLKHTRAVWEYWDSGAKWSITCLE